MEIKGIFNNVLNSKYVIVDENELNSILNNVEILRIEDTYLSDLIRLLKFDNNLFIQETAFNKEIIIRKMNSLDEADKFFQERLDYYERKWDGCGCKIDYFE